MKLVTRKSECRPAERKMLVKSPKEAIRKTLSNYLVKDGFIVKAFLPSYVTRDTLVLRNIADCEELSIKLAENLKLANFKN